MLMALVRLARVSPDCVELTLELPSGFSPEQVEGDSIRVNGELRPKEWSQEPRRKRPSDIFRLFHVVFPRPDVEDLLARGGESVLRVTGALRNGIRMEGICLLPAELLAAKVSRAS